MEHILLCGRRRSGRSALIRRLLQGIDVPVFGMSVITNEAHDDYAEDYVNDGDDMVKAADAAAVKMTALVEKMIEAL